MAEYMDTIMGGYASEISLDGLWLDRLPLFVRPVQLETFLHYAQYIGEDDPEDQAMLAYMRRCFDRDLPWMGFFDSQYDARRPFMA